MRIQTEKDTLQRQLNEKIELNRTLEPGKAAELEQAADLKKLAGSSKLPVAAGGQGVPADKGEALALAGDMEKTERLKAGMSLIEEQKKLEQVRAEQEKEEKKETTEEDKTEKTDKDSVRLSKLSKLFASGIKDKAYLWTLEMEMELWEALLKWGPFNAKEDAGQKLQELSRLYQLLLKAIMQNTEGDNRALQLGRLNQGLACALDRLKDSSLHDLFQIMEQFEGAKASADLRASIYYQATGRTLSAKEANTFWNAAKQGAPSVMRGGRPADSKNTAGGGFDKSGGLGTGQTRGTGEVSAFGNRAGENMGLEGRVYGRPRGSVQSAQAGSFKNNQNSAATGSRQVPVTETRSASDIMAGGAAVRGRSQYLSTMKSGEEAAFMAAGRGTQAGVYAVGAAKGRPSFSMADMQKAENFARYLNQGGNLFTNREITARNEELLGCLCADLDMKGQLFADGFGIGDRMKTTVRSAVGNMIDCYLKEAEHRMQAEQSHYPLNRKAVYKIYYHILQQNQQRRDPSLVMEQGIAYASGLFEEKKRDDGYRQAERYSREAGFFGAFSAREEERTGKKKGRRLFSDSWTQFMDMAERYGINYQELLQTSPWGMNLSPEAVRGKNSLGRTAAVFAACGAAALGVYCLNYFLK